MGLDVLNPIQCNCVGMDPAELKRDFGPQLTFMGGVDTQGLLPIATPDEVRRGDAQADRRHDLRRRRLHFGRLAHDPARDALENIFAMYHEAGRDPRGGLRPCRRESAPGATAAGQRVQTGSMET